MRLRRVVGQAVLAQLAHGRVVKLHGHADILARGKCTGRAAIGGLQIPRHHIGAVVLAGHYPQCLQGARRLANGLVQPRLGGNQLTRQQPVGLVPGCHQRGRGGIAQHLLNGAQQMPAHNRIVCRHNAHGGVFVDNPLQHRCQSGGIVDMGRVGKHRCRQRLLLDAAGLVAQVEQIVQLGVGSKHLVVKQPGDGVAVFAQHRHAGVDIRAGSSR